MRLETQLQGRSAANETRDLAVCGQTVDEAVILFIKYVEYLGN